MRLSEIGEFGLINRISKRFPNYSSNVIKGIGDDSAVIALENSNYLLLTTDMLIEDIHFNLKWTTGYLLGKKSLAVNLSDIAGMGGIPKYCLVNLGLPLKIEVEYVDEMYSGMNEWFKRFSIDLVGGDTCFEKERLIISIILTGEILPNKVVLREGARIGDLICVTGKLGESALGLKILQSQKTIDGAQKLISTHLDPVPRVEEGLWIAERRLATSMIDLSDGLVGDIKHILNGNIGARIWIDRIPLSDDFQKIALTFSKRIIDIALSGGEDYELLFTIPPNRLKDIEDFKDEFECSATVIGEIMDRPRDIELIDSNGRQYEGDIRSFDHFNSRN